MLHVGFRPLVLRLPDVAVHQRLAGGREADLVHVVSVFIGDAGLAAHPLRPRVFPPLQRVPQPPPGLGDLAPVRPQEPLEGPWPLQPAPLVRRQGVPRSRRGLRLERRQPLAQVLLLYLGRHRVGRPSHRARPGGRAGRPAHLEVWSGGGRCRGGGAPPLSPRSAAGPAVVCCWSVPRSVSLDREVVFLSFLSSPNTPKPGRVSQRSGTSRDTFSGTGSQRRSTRRGGRVLPRPSRRPPARRRGRGTARSRFSGVRG